MSKSALLRGRMLFLWGWLLALLSCRDPDLLEVEVEIPGMFGVLSETLRGNPANIEVAVIAARRSSTPYSAPEVGTAYDPNSEYRRITVWNGADTFRFPILYFGGSGQLGRVEITARVVCGTRVVPFVVGEARGGTFTFFPGRAEWKFPAPTAVNAAPSCN